MIIQADILEWATRYEGDPFHAAFMDAPYHLAEITRRFGKPGSAQAQFGSDGAFQRASKGFMGKQWDGGDITFRAETWDAIARHVHPGGWIVSFGGSRTWHRMACAMEDAGLIIQPTMFLWNYSTGFPKATRPDAHIDAKAFRAWLAEHPSERDRLQVFRDQVRDCKRNAKENPGSVANALLEAARSALKDVSSQLKTQADLAPRVVGQKKHAPKFDAAGHGYREKDNGYNSKDRESFDLTEPATELARDWAGHRYGGQAIKPAVEPIIFAQKPYDGPPVDSMTRTGAGGRWIDGARIGADVVGWGGGGASGAVFNSTTSGLAKDGAARLATGRWPANFALSHSPACNGTCVSDCPVRRLGEQSGEGKSKRSQRGQINAGQFGGMGNELLVRTGDSTERGHDDSGTAARYFFNSDWQYERLEATDPVGYFAKASKSEREAGLDDMQMRLMHDLYGLDDDEFEDGTIDDGRPTPIDNPFQRGETTRKNIHPTLKPISLNRWLATLLLPPARYAPRRLLVPFAGVASEYIGAMLAGWEAIIGVELEEQHVKIAQARIAYWQQMRYRLNADTPVRVRVRDRAPEGQLELF